MQAKAAASWACRARVRCRLSLDVQLLIIILSGLPKHTKSTTTDYRQQTDRKIDTYLDVGQGSGQLGVQGAGEVQAEAGAVGGAEAAHSRHQGLAPGGGREHGGQAGQAVHAQQQLDPCRQAPSQ